MSQTKHDVEPHGWFVYHPHYEPRGEWQALPLTEADKKDGWTQRAAYQGIREYKK